MPNDIVLPLQVTFYRNAFDGALTVACGGCGGQIWKEDRENIYITTINDIWPKTYEHRGCTREGK